jgi:hypothetical protein
MTPLPRTGYLSVRTGLDSSRTGSRLFSRRYTRRRTTVQGGPDLVVSPMPMVDLRKRVFGPLARPGILDDHRPLSTADENNFLSSAILDHKLSAKPLGIYGLILRPPPGDQSVNEVFGVH